MVLSFVKLTLTFVANFTLICKEYIEDPNPKIPLLTQEDLEEKENENEIAIAKKDDSVVHTAEDIDGQEAKGAIQDPKSHDEDGEGKRCCLLFPLLNCKEDTNFH